MKKMTCILLLGIVSFCFSQPESEIIEDEEKKIYDEACSNAYRDAEKDTDAFMWISCGFFCSAVGVCAAYAAPYVNLEDRLVGRSYEYVATYTYLYMEQSRKIRKQSACIGASISGCLAVTAIGIIECGAIEENCIPYMGVSW